MQAGGVSRSDDGSSTYGSLRVGASAGSDGTHNMEDGIYYPCSCHFAIGYGGRGTCSQSGRTINWHSTKNSDLLYSGGYVHPVVGYPTNSYGVYNLSGGTCTAYTLSVGLAGAGIVHQTGGLLAVGLSLP